jgi:hypothetical protein
MNRAIITKYLGMLMVCLVPSLNAQEFRQHISREFLVSKAENSILYIYNLNGSLKVEGYEGNKILLEMDQTISASDIKKLEIGKKEFRMAFDQQADTVIAYIAAPYDSRPHRNWHYNDDHEEIDYNYNVDFTVKVPFSASLHISTVNDGKISVSNVNGILHLNNVNDEIIVKNAVSNTFAHTVNGDVTINYLKNPPDESSYYTINGNIRISYLPDLSADLQFKSMQGDFYTDFPNAEILPPSVTKKQDKKDGSIIYQLNACLAVRFGKGGRTFKFETLNGNVYIKKQS